MSWTRALVKKREKKLYFHGINSTARTIQQTKKSRVGINHTCSTFSQCKRQQETVMYVCSLLCHTSVWGVINFKWCFLLTHSFSSIHSISLLFESFPFLLIFLLLPVYPFRNINKYDNVSWNIVIYGLNRSA